MQVFRVFVLPSVLVPDAMYLVSAVDGDDCEVTFTGRDGLPRVLAAGVPDIEWVDIGGKPATFPPISHTHTISDVTGLTSALAGLQPAGSYATAAQGALAATALQPGAQIPWTDVTGKPAFFDGAYSSLTGLPTLFDGAYDSLTGRPILFSGSYDDLTDAPALGTLAARNITIGTTAPVSPAVGDLWVDTN